MIPHVVYGQPLDTEGLSGTLALRLDEDYLSDWFGFCLTQDLGRGRRFATIIPVSRGLVADRAAMHAIAQIAVDRLRPWRDPDTWTGWPRAFVLLPRLDRLGRLLEAAKGRWGR